MPDGIDAAVQDAISSGSVPGAVVVVGRHDGVVFRRAYGLREVQPDRETMTTDTVFDLASLTKPIATATSVMVLVERGAVGLDDPLAKYVPECSQKGKGAITLRQLLLHVSGLPADTPKDDFSRGRAEAIRRICSVPLRGVPGGATIYSDLGFVLLEEVVRRVTSRELPSFASEAIFTPLGMRETGFTPGEDLRRRAAWTELVDGAWRVGVVHDPRAYLLGRGRGPCGALLDGRRRGDVRAGHPGRRRRRRASDPLGADRGLDDRSSRRAGRRSRARMGRREPVEGRRALTEGGRPLRLHGHRALDRPGQGSLRGRPDEPGASGRQGGLEAARRPHQHAGRARDRAVGRPCRRVRRCGRTARGPHRDRRPARRGVRPPPGKAGRPHHQRERPRERRDADRGPAPRRRRRDARRPVHARARARRLGSGEDRERTRRANGSSGLQPVRRFVLPEP